MLKIKKISSKNKNFSENLKKHISQRKFNTSDIKEKVRVIISEVKKNGDEALIKYSKEFDNFDIQDAKQLEISKDKCEEALKKITKKEFDALMFAKKE